VNGRTSGGERLREKLRLHMQMLATKSRRKSYPDDARPAVPNGRADRRNHHAACAVAGHAEADAHRDFRPARDDAARYTALPLVV